MVVLTIVTQKNGDTVYFDMPIPKVHFMKLLSCSLFNSWVTHEGRAGLDDRKLNPDKSVSILPAGYYDLDSLGKKITDLLSDFNYKDFETEKNTPFGQLVIKNTGASKISLGGDLAKLIGTEQYLPMMITTIKQITSTTAYFIHCDLIDKTNNLFNNKRTDLLAKFDVKGKPYEKVSYVCSSEQPFRDCSTDSHVNSITLSVRDQDGELFDFQGLPIEFELDLN